MAHLLSELFHDPAHGGMGGVGLTALDGAGHVNVKLKCFVVRQIWHQAVFRPAGEDLGHKILELGKHGVAGSLEYGGMELHVQPEELLLLSALARGP